MAGPRIGMGHVDELARDACAEDVAGQPGTAWSALPPARLVTLLGLHRPQRR